MNETLPDCPSCATPLRRVTEPDAGPVTCPRCRRTFRSPSPTEDSGSGSGEYATAGPLHIEGGHVEVACPDCGAALRVREKYVGRHVRCGGCHAKFLVQFKPASALDGPPADQAGSPDPTPDPDDPWQGRAEVLRLLGQVSTLRAENDGLRAQAERLEGERDAARREIARLQAEAARARSNGDRYAPRGDDVVTYRFPDEAARASGA